MSKDIGRWLVWVGLATQLLGLAVARFDLRRVPADPADPPEPSRSTSLTGWVRSANPARVVTRWRGSEPDRTHHDRTDSLDFVVGPDIDESVSVLASEAPVERWDRQARREREVARPRVDDAGPDLDPDQLAGSGRRALHEMRVAHDARGAAREREARKLRRVWRGLGIVGLGVVAAAAGTLISNAVEPSPPDTGSLEVVTADDDASN